jgi:hypothetical protein
MPFDLSMKEKRYLLSDLATISTRFSFSRIKRLTNDGVDHSRPDGNQLFALRSFWAFPIGAKPNRS